MSGHWTPGPWRFYTSPQPNGCPIVGTHKGLMVAMLAHSVNHLEQKIEAISNARLIAAAPELLEALQEIVSDYEFCKAHPSFGDRGESYAETARAAIAKATGKQP